MTWVFGHDNTDIYQRAHYLNVTVFFVAMLYLLMSAFGKVPFRRSEEEWESVWREIDNEPEEKA